MAKQLLEIPSYRLQCHRIFRVQACADTLQIILAVSLSGCAGIDYLSKNYSDAKLIPVVTDDGNWNIVDMPEQSKILVQSGLAEAMAQGFTGGLSLNPTATAMPRPDYEKAANKYLADADRSCRVKDGFLVVEPTWVHVRVSDGANWHRHPAKQGRIRK